MEKYLIKLEIKGVEFQIRTSADNPKEAEENALEVIRSKTTFISILEEKDIYSKDSFGKRLDKIIKGALSF
jgi:hypothetical protein